MIDVARIDHISMAVRDLEPQIEFLERVLGFRYHGRFVQPGYVGAELEVPGRSGIVWELLAPDGPDSFLHRFLDGRGPGLHHVSMQVRDMGAAVTTMRSLGIEPWGYERRGGGPIIEANEDEVVRPEADPALDRGLDASTEDGSSDQGGDAVDADRDAVAYIHPRAGGAGFLFQLYAGTPWYLPEPFDDDRSDTIGITALHALGHAHHSRLELGGWYERLFGFQTVHLPPSTLSDASFSTRVLETPRSQLRIEVMQPTREDSFLQRFLDRHGPAIHHVSFEVRSVERAIAACERNGVRILGEGSGQSEAAHWEEAFLAPEDTGGVLMQVFAWRPLEREARGDEPDQPLV